MHKLGLNKAVGYYCSKAGGRGLKLLEELSSANEKDSASAETDDDSLKLDSDFEEVTSDSYPME